MKTPGPVLLLVLLLQGCHPDDHHQSIQDKLKENPEGPHAWSIPKKDFDKRNFLEWDSFEDQKFFVEKVWDASKEQGCKSCHEGYALKEMTGEGFKRAHWDIVLSHGSDEIMNCQTCHNNNNVWQFHFGREQSVTADYVPKLCSQCHSGQYKDWAEGSHGKRANGWQYPRAITTCTSCHNPHHPAFEKIWPKVAPHRYH